MLTGFQPQFNNTTGTEERSQPWHAMQEVQNLFKPEMPANANSGADANSQTEKTEEPLKLNSFRTSVNSATTNIADVDKAKEEPLKLNSFRTSVNSATTNIANVDENKGEEEPVKLNVDKTEEEPLKLNVFRTSVNSSTTNIADVEL